jgi:hypothetical protein
MPLQNLIDSLALLDALKSEDDHWVEIHLDYPLYDPFTVHIFTQGEER